MSTYYTGHRGRTLADTNSIDLSFNAELEKVQGDIISDPVELWHASFTSGGSGARVISETYYVDSIMCTFYTLQVWNHKVSLRLAVLEGVPDYVLYLNGPNAVLGSLGCFPDPDYHQDTWWKRHPEDIHSSDLKDTIAGTGKSKL